MTGHGSSRSAGATGASLAVEYEPQLVEEAVLQALRGHPEERSFRRTRDRLYEIEEPRRDGAFAALHAEWFVRLELHRPLQTALAEQPLIISAVERCLCARSRQPGSEGAELFVKTSPDGPHRTVRIALRAETLCGGSLLDFLRHELQHVADMLDPAFGYQPTLPPSAVGPVHDRLLADRYRVLWDTIIDGRLLRHGRLGKHAQARRWQEFAATFAMLGDDLEPAFARFFSGERAWTHAELVAFASAPLGSETSRRCALCGCPAFRFDDNLSAETQALIARDFPRWTPRDGACPQCADLYRAHSPAAC